MRKEVAKEHIYVMLVFRRRSWRKEHVYVMIFNLGEKW
jgi:hypothetical protein